jgi:hypothetical protein
MSGVYVLFLLAVGCGLLDARGTALRGETIDRRLQTDDNGAGCSTGLSTAIDGDLAASYGIIFTIESASTDSIGPTVASLGFHVEPSLIMDSSFDFEVYALNSDGYYTDPERTDNPFDELSYDYRGELSEWSMISSGSVSKQDLQNDELTVS